MVEISKEKYFEYNYYYYLLKSILQSLEWRFPVLVYSYVSLLVGS